MVYKWDPLQSKLWKWLDITEISTKIPLSERVYVGTLIMSKSLILILASLSNIY